MIDYYEILEVSKKASLEVIREAHKVLLHQYYLLHDAEDQSQVQTLENLNLAYEVLSDPDKREAYDHELNKARSVLNESARASSPNGLMNENSAQFSQANSNGDKAKVSAVSAKASILSRLKWNKWGWSVSILIVVAVLISMVQPDPEKALRGHEAVQEHVVKKEIESEVKQTEADKQLSDAVENKAN
jgi:curved DNA-binding protein CbpA